MSYTLYHGCVKSAIEPIINGEYGVEKSTPYCSSLALCRRKRNLLLRYGDSINSWEDICIEDNSCENMRAAVCMDADTFNSLVKEGKVGFKVHKYEFFSKLALCYIASMPTENTLFNKDCLSKGELKACKAIMDAGIYFDEIYEASQIDCYEVLLLTFKQ